MHTTFIGVESRAIFSRPADGTDLVSAEGVAALDPAVLVVEPGEVGAGGVGPARVAAGAGVLHVGDGRADVAGHPVVGVDLEARCEKICNQVSAFFLENDNCDLRGRALGTP